MPKFISAVILLVAASGLWPQYAESSSCAFVAADQAAACESAALKRFLLKHQVAQLQRKGVSPISAWQCPASHPIKGNLTPASGERCIFHSPGEQFFDKTKPEMCYANPADAIADGCRSSRR